MDMVEHVGIANFAFAGGDNTLVDFMIVSIRKEIKTFCNHYFLI